MDKIQNEILDENLRKLFQGSAFNRGIFLHIQDLIISRGGYAGVIQTSC